MITQAHTQTPARTQLARLTYQAKSYLHCFIRVSIFVVLGSLLVACQSPTRQPVKIAPTVYHEFLVGTYNKNLNEGIWSIKLNATTGELSTPTNVAAAINPSYLAWNKNKNRLFAVVETKDGGITQYQKQPQDLSFVKTYSLQKIAFAPCYISLSPNEKYLATANYVSGDVQFFDISTNKPKLLKTIKHQGKGPSARQKSSHLHWIAWSPDGKDIYSADLGGDAIYHYQLAQGEFIDKGIAYKASPGDGPRHMTFHPQTHQVYVLNELSNSVTVLQRQPETGKLSYLQKRSTLNANFTKFSKAAAIKISSDGQYLYASNRGANTLAVFSIRKNGYLRRIQNISTGGEEPRDFTISPDGHFIVVANQNSNSLSVLIRNPTTGLLSNSQHQQSLITPVFVGAL
ncbi:hypothetical protein C2869_12105 [Saccharobesus litoralis]|uniref:6-phosphogluconolactonase n=1 Tax=Saccharobesus litoralis TaxID=2172099 RepID=A0A2S0VSQ1_9ALTE|nr:lactonase family protein [Saccharobesus litoralis]AWB67130.1 hypothetical protein C2869_12105 [Saccharobesus litoralis]